ncbi:sensor histidine kinase [Neolewinella aurantiaca]|nr:HAMP domain-containing sensor histidine kinase [Neolewinella aurantiaca]
MFQDELGFIWLETSKQLQRFDGAHFSSVPEFRELPDSEDLLSHIYEAPGPWVLQMRYLTDSLKNNAPFDTLVDPVGDNWSVLEARFINSLTLETKTWNSYWEDSPPAFPIGDVYQLYKNKSDDVYRVTLKNGAMFRFDGQWKMIFPPGQTGKVQHIVFSPQGWYLMLRKQTLSIHDEDDEELWSMQLCEPLANNRVLARGGKWYASSLLEELLHPLLLPDLDLNDLPGESERLQEHFQYLNAPVNPGVRPYRSPDNSVLYLEIPLKTETCNIINGKGEVYCRLNGLKYRHLMLVDGQGNYWFHGGGRLQVGKPVPKIFKQTSSLNPKGSVRSFVRFSDSLLWENSYSGVNVYKLPFRPEEEPLYRYPDQVYGIVSVSESEGEVLTGGHAADLMRSTPGEKHRFVNEEFTRNTSHVSITTMLTTRKGIRWAGTVNNLYHYFDGEWKEALRGYFSGFEIHCMREHKDGIWVGTSGGFFLLAPDGHRVLLSPRACRGVQVYEWLREGNTFWLATNQGLQRWEIQSPEIEMICDFSDVMPISSVHAVYRNSSGQFILPTNFGLAVYDHENKRRRICKEEDGLPNDELNRYAHLRLPDGTLVMGSISGSFFFDPDDLNIDLLTEDKKYEAVCAVSVFDRNSGWQSRNLSEKDSVKNLNIGVEEVSVRIRLSSFRFLDVGTQGLFYRLKGLSDEWRQVVNGVLEFNTPNYGDYVFQVRSGGDQDDSGKMLLSFNLRVTPPLFTQWSFWALIVVVILLMFMVFYNVRRALWLRSQRKLENGIAVATEELREVNAWKSKIMTTAGHDLKGPMMSLMGMGQKVKFLIDQKQWTRLDLIGMQIDGLALQAYHTLDNLLLLGRKKRHSQLPSSEVDVVDLCDNQLDFVRPMAVMKGVELSFEHEHVNSFKGSRYALSSVIRNLLHNAISFAGTKVNLRVVNVVDGEHSSITVQITDDGPGFSPETKNAINHQKRALAGFVSSHNSSGMGWSVIIDVLIENGISWRVENKNSGKGASVTLTFPFQRLSSVNN